jgi:hypothetical protein
MKGDVKMRGMTRWTLAVGAGALAVSAMVAAAQGGSGQTIDLAAQQKSGALRAVNRAATPLTGDRPGIQVSEAAGNGVVWVEKSEFGLGTIELDVRGRDLQGQSFVGVAFHRQDDTTYEGVYLRPFNFRNADVARRQNAVQYISLPDYDWPRLRKEFPSEFENPVDESVVPTDWVRLRIVVTEKTVQVFVGGGATAALEVRRLGAHNGGAVGLWVGNGSDGAFANLKLTPAK